VNFDLFPRHQRDERALLFMELKNANLCIRSTVPSVLIKHSWDERIYALWRWI